VEHLRLVSVKTEDGPGGFLANFWLGNVLFQQQNYSQATIYYDRAISASEHAPTPLELYKLYNNTAAAHEQCGNKKLALRNFRLSQIFKPKDYYPIEYSAPYAWNVV